MFCLLRLETYNIAVLILIGIRNQIIILVIWETSILNNFVLIMQNDLYGNASEQSIIVIA
jgi:hypothetical protein